MRSPIINLQNHIASVAFNIAPEKAEDCAMLRDTHGISFDLIDDKDFSIRVGSSNVILLPIASLEYLWAFSLYSTF